MSQFCNLLLILCIANFGAVKSTCPQNCECFPSFEETELHCPPIGSSGPPDYYGSTDYIIKYRKRSIEIDCSSFKLNYTTNFPSLNLSSVTILKLERCPLPPNGFKQLGAILIGNGSLQQLEISETSIDKVPDECFEALTNLRNLSLNSIHLRTFNMEVLSKTPKLERLELNQNQIKHLTGKFNSKLLELNLLSNQIVDVPDDFFKAQDTMTILYLSNNNLTKITERTFTGLSNLKLLELSVNYIDSIDENALNSLPKLELLSLKKNKLIEVPKNLFAKNYNLRLVTISYNNIKALSGDLFQSCRMLETLKLNNLELTTLPSTIFSNLDRLREVELANNRLQVLPGDLLKGLTSLTDLKLANNAIQNLDNDLFGNLNELINLDLSFNQITIRNYRLFLNLQKLENINLSNNLINTDFNFPFEGELINSKQLKIIDLSHNQIEDYSKITSLNTLLYLKSADFSFNHIKDINLVDFQSIVLDSKPEIDLTANNITFVNFADVKIHVKANEGSITSVAKIYLDQNPISCDCQNFDLLQYEHLTLEPEVRQMFELNINGINCTNAQNFGIEFTKLRLSDIFCQLSEMHYSNETCDDRCFCYGRPYDNTFVANCSHQRFDYYPKIDFIPNNFYKQLEVDLSKNKLTKGLSKNFTYKNLVLLDLSRNQIENFDWLPPNLTKLYMDHNKLTILDNKTFNILASSELRQVSLHDNPWKCDCEIQPFVDFLHQQSKRIFLSPSKIYCDNTLQAIISLNHSDICIDWVVPTVILFLALLLAVATLVALYLRYQQEIKIWLYAKQMCLWWVKEHELDKDKIYDAFISYSYQDEAFIIKNLLPALEDGPEPYKLCLHIRDWVPGETISQQVFASVAASRRTIVILTKDFIASSWGNFEFRTAHAEAMKEGRARVIVVLVGKIDIESLDDDLRAYLQTNTYLEWGDKYFWRKLRYSLPHREAFAQKHANLMSYIDSKFRVGRKIEVSDPESTPPIVSQPKKDTDLFPQMIVENEIKM